MVCRTSEWVNGSVDSKLNRYWFYWTSEGVGRWYTKPVPHPLKRFTLAYKVALISIFLQLPWTRDKMAAFSGNFLKEPINCFNSQYLRTLFLCTTLSIPRFFRQKINQTHLRGDYPLIRYFLNLSRKKFRNIFAAIRTLCRRLSRARNCFLPVNFFFSPKLSESKWASRAAYYVKRR